MRQLVIRNRSEAVRLIIGGAISLALMASQSGAAEKGTHHQVIIKRFKFDPAELVIAAGDTVEWVNLDLVPHTATDDAGKWDTDNLVKGSAGRVHFIDPGDVSYFCRYHPNMRGKIKVLQRMNDN